MSNIKSFGFASVIAGGLVAAVLGLAAPAQAATAVGATDVVSILQTVPAGIDHHVWLDQIQPRANAPQVDTTVHQSR